MGSSTSGQGADSSGTARSPAGDGSDAVEQIEKEYFGGLFLALCGVTLVSTVLFALEFYTRKRFWDNWS